MRCVSIIAVLLLAIPAGLASAEPIFSQTKMVSYSGSIGSDRDAIWGAGAQVFDDLTLGSPATVRSVTWWGRRLPSSSQRSMRGPF